MTALNEIGRRSLERDSFPMTPMVDLHLKIIGMQQFRTETDLWGQVIRWAPSQPVEIGGLRGLDLSAWLQQAPDVAYVLWHGNTPMAWVWGPPEARYVVRERYSCMARYLGFTNYLPTGL